MTALSRLLACVLASGLLAACTTSEPYWTKLGPFPATDGTLAGAPHSEPNKHCEVLQEPDASGGHPPSVHSCMAIVEFDDYGNPMNRAQLLGAADAARAAAEAGATILVYVHGWHENAKPDAPDLQNFRRLVARASKLDVEYSMKSLPAGNVFGVYVAWRGDSISARNIAAPASYLLTFWDRKSAAQRIGSSGGIYELLMRLSEIRQQNPNSRLVIQGHSFGGALLYSAFSTSLIDQMMRDANGVRPESGSVSRGEPIRSPPVADLMVLLNPAFEAMRLRPQFELARTFEYRVGPDRRDFLPPRLVIVTSEADWATRLVFPLGRKAGSSTDAYIGIEDSFERRAAQEANVTAVGHYVPLITHQLARAPAGKCEPRPAGTSRMELLLPSTLCIEAFLTPDLPRMLLTRCDKPGDCSQVVGIHHVQRGRVVDGRVPFRLPIMNIRTTKDVASSHTDIWNDTLQNFITQLTILSIRNPGAIPLQVK